MSKLKQLLNIGKTQLLQSHIDAALYYKVRQRMKQDKVKWRPLLEALLKIYLSEDEK